MKLNTACDMENAQLLPILLVSAKDKGAANSIVTEIIGYTSEDSGSNQDCPQNEVWKISNKYYSANVSVQTLFDSEKLDTSLEDYIEGHVIYLTQDECDGEEAVRTMQRRAEAGSGASVRLVVTDASAEPPALAAACARERLELVPLRAAAAGTGSDSDDDERGERGAGRVRAALHAHLWTGLERRGRSDPPPPGLEAAEAASEASESSDAEWSEWCAGPGEAGAEQRFAAALGSLAGAAAAARRAGGAREERLARAEQLVAAFCHALGTPFD